MFSGLQERPTDALLGLIAAYKADARTTKIDVGVGVYKDDAGNTPVMAAVKMAETKILSQQLSKTYLGLVGDPVFNQSMTSLVLGEHNLGERVRAVQTTGGCAALRALADLIAISKPDAVVWVSDPTWINHVPLITSARLQLKTYPYFDATSQSVNFTAMLECLKTLGPNDLVLLHGACHNPTGVDLSEVQWREIGALALARGFTPLIDLAYQGLGRGMDEDAFAVRHLACVLPELLVAVSCSKSFAIYRERTGLAMVIGSNAAQSKNMLDHLLTAIRGNYSMPPDHGAACVAMILQDSALRQVWSLELSQMRERIAHLRKALSKQFSQESGSARFDYIAQQYGMFSLLGLGKDQVTQLREQHGIYMPNDSRTNIAGLSTSQVAPFVKAVLSVS
jgi:aspartate/tyrosine/aromatic aminotransferase